MYLLYRDARNQIRLTCFGQEDVPPYAILSHIWGEDEVSFQELHDGRGQDKAGYRKIEFCVEQAAKDGIQYCWVDTCCIDRTDSVELSVAVNSMFLWYKNSERCYVYLSDVPENDFRLSRWFTRGWTLQELLAPSNVEFFSAENHKLGDKRTLMQDIHERTQIPVAALEGKAFAEFDIDEKVSWAAGRATNIEEDMVYCLLGILDISMPIMYGEGRERAEFRLRKHIKESLESTLSTLDSIGNVYADQGKLEEAEAINARVLKGRIFQSEHASTLQTIEKRLDDGTLQGERIQFPIQLTAQTGIGIEDEEDHLTMSDMSSVRTGIDSEKDHFPTAQTAIQDNTIIDFLCQLPEIRSLCMYAAARGHGGQQRLCQNVVKALKRLYISCRDRVEKDTDDGSLSCYQTALRYRKRRLGIAWRTIGRIVSESASLRPIELETIGEEAIEGTDASRSSESDYDSDGRSPIEVAASPMSVEPAPASDLPKEYNKHGEFTELLISLSLKTIPIHLRTVLMEAPTGRLCIIDNAEDSFSNKVKIYAENLTGTRWAWDPALHPLPAEKTRLFYTCTCGEQLIRVLPREVAIVVGNILKLRKSLKEDFGHGESMQEQRGEHLPGPATASRRAKSSGTAYQRVRNWLTAIASKTSGPPNEDQSDENPLRSNDSPDKQSKRSQDESQVTDRWIIVGFQGSRSSLEIEHISVDDSKLDFKFFKELKQRFRYHIPFWKRWLSIWKLYSCQYVQFEKICANDVHHEAHRWPAPQQAGYDFIDWESDATDAPISESRFHDILKLCDDTCLRKRLHVCMLLGNLKTRDYIRKMPNKLFPQFDHKGDGMGIAWGIRPVLEPRLEMVMVYVLLALTIVCVAFIVFWLNWVSQHPDDLQNASVPLLAFLAFIGVVAQMTCIVYSCCRSLQQGKAKID